jgi:hypothetical protein
VEAEGERERRERGGKAEFFSEIDPRNKCFLWAIFSDGTKDETSAQMYIMYDLSLLFCRLMVSDH